MSITIITPTLNSAPTLERTIPSVLSQRVDNLEYLVIDGGSTDETPTLFKKYDPRVHFISEHDEGPTDAINKALKIATGDIIGLLNAGDIYYPTTLINIQDYFTHHSSVDVVYGDLYLVNQNNETVERCTSELWNLKKFKENCFLYRPTVFFKRSLLERFGYFNTNLRHCMDYEFWLRLAQEGVVFAYLPEILAGAPAIEQPLNKEAHKEINDMLKKTIGQVPDTWLSNYARSVIASDNKQHEDVKKAIAIKTLLASLHWNNWISKPLLTVCLKWFATDLKKI